MITRLDRDSSSLEISFCRCPICSVTRDNSYDFLFKVVDLPLAVRLSDCLPPFLFVCLSVCPSLVGFSSVRSSFKYLSYLLSVLLSICLSVLMSFCMLSCLSFCSACPSFHFFVYLSSFLSVCIFLTGLISYAFII